MSAEALIDAGTKVDPPAFAMAGGAGDASLVNKLKAKDADPNGPGRGPSLSNACLCLRDLLSGNGVVGCRRVRDGSLIWERRLQEFGGKVPNWGYSAAVLIYRDLAIVVPGGAECVVALDKISGEWRWATQGYSAGAEYCSPILVAHPDGDFVVAATKSGLLGVDVASGRVLWANSYSTRAGINAATPLYADGYVFWPNGFTKGAVCLKIERDRTATQVWQTDEDPECHLGDFVADAGCLYGHHGRAWKCFELATGKELWASKALGTGAACYADGMLYLFQERRGVAALAKCSPEGLDIRGKAQVEGDGPSWAHPVVAGGRLYLRYSTTSYGFDVTQPTERCHHLLDPELVTKRQAGFEILIDEKLGYSIFLSAIRVSKSELVPAGVHLPAATLSHPTLGNLRPALQPSGRSANLARFAARPSLQPTGDLCKGSQRVTLTRGISGIQTSFCSVKERDDDRRPGPQRHP